MRRHLGLLCSLLLPLLACDGASGSDGACTPDPALASGTAAATLDGAAWTTSATWLWQGESVQINADPADGWRFSLVGQLTDAGDTVQAAADAGAFPITVPLGTSGGWVTVFPTEGGDGSYHTKNAAGGTLTITEVGDELAGCFDFSAGTEAGDAVELTSGSVRATLLEL